jgi:1,4-alpha-glucan branching enzyme
MNVSLEEIDEKLTKKSSVEKHIKDFEKSDAPQFKGKSKDEKEEILVVFNMTPVPRHDYPIHVYGNKQWKEIFNSDDKSYWGVGDLYNKVIRIEPQDDKKEWFKLTLELPALSAIVLK